MAYALQVMPITEKKQSWSVQLTRSVLRVLLFFTVLTFLRSYIVNKTRNCKNNVHNSMQLSKKGENEKWTSVFDVATESSVLLTIILTGSKRTKWLLPVGRSSWEWTQRSIRGSFLSPMRSHSLTANAQYKYLFSEVNICLIGDHMRFFTHDH